MNDGSSIISLKSNFLERKELKFSELERFSHYWIINSIINSLYSSNNAIDDILKYNYFKGSIFQIIRLQLNIILNNIDLIKLSQKENSAKAYVWRELGNSVTSFIFELMEKWDAKLCELQHHHLNNCEVTFSELVSETTDYKYKIKEMEIMNNFIKVKDEDLWENEELFWEIDNLYPFREFQFGMKSDILDEKVYSIPVTLIYLNSILRPYVCIWSNIRWFFNNLVTCVFLNEDINSKNIEFKKIELNIFILEILFDNVEKSILFVDNYMINIWSSLLRRCIENFIKIIPKFDQKPLFTIPDIRVNNVNNYFECIKILHDILSINNTNQFFTNSIGELLGINENNDILILDNILSKIKFSNVVDQKPIDLLRDVDIEKSLNKFPISMLYKCEKNQLSNFFGERYTFYNILGKRICDLNRSLNIYYKELFIKNSRIKLNYSTIFIKDDIKTMDEKMIKIVDLLICMKDLVILEDVFKEQLIRALYLDSKKKFPNIDVDPTEVNLSIKLINNKNLKDEKIQFIRKIMSIFVLEFEASNSKDYIKEQLPTFYSLKIRLNININTNSNTSTIQTQTFGIPNTIILKFFDSDILEEYSFIFSFLLEVKRCSIFLSQVFQSLIYIDRNKQKIALCRQKKAFKEDFDYDKFCSNDCTAIKNWLELLLQISQKIRFSIQFIVDIYHNYFAMHISVIWKEFEHDLSSNKPVSFMIESHKNYIEKLHMLTLAPNKKILNSSNTDELFQLISINFVLLLKLGRRLSILTGKIEQLVEFLSNANKIIKKKKYIPCLILRRKIQDIVKKLLLEFEILYSDFKDYKLQFINSIYIYNKSNPEKKMEYLLLQLRNIQ